MSNPSEQDPIDTYLDSVCDWIQMLPAEDVAEIREELRLHLVASVQGMVTDGLHRNIAVTAAIKKFGPATLVGRALLFKSPNGWIWRFMWGNAEQSLLELRSSPMFNEI